MNLIVDASVAVKWFLDESGCEAARSLLGENAVLAPDLILLEAYNAVWKRWRRGEAHDHQLDAVVPLLTQVLERLSPSHELADQAAALSRDLRHPIYDCTYLALAKRESLPLVTADRRLFEIGQSAGIAARMLGAG